jgi:hypothetical protein
MVNIVTIGAKLSFLDAEVGELMKEMIYKSDVANDNNDYKAETLIYLLQNIKLYP